MTARDKRIFVLVLFFVLMAFAIELPWLVWNDTLATRHDWFGRFWALYGNADEAYYSHPTSLVLGLESFHIVFTQWIYIWLLYAIVKKRTGRYAVEVIVGSYVCYSTALYLLANHLNGYAHMRNHTAGNMLMLYLPNLPWLLGNFYLAADGFAVIRSHFAAPEPGVVRQEG